MKINYILTRADYLSPVCTCMEISAEGVLCASFGNEDYEDNMNYDDGTDGKGWI